MLNKILSGRGRLTIHIFGWTLVYFLFFYLISGIKGPEVAAWRATITLLFLLVIFYGNGKILINQFFEKGRYTQWAILSIFFWLLFSALRAWIEFDYFGGSLFNIAGPIRRPVSATRIFAGYSLSFLLLFVFSGLYQLLENRRELEAKHTEAQLNYLKAQINPHFLFNTLNNIYSAATLQHPNTALMVLRLSDLLRYVTYDAQEKLTRLSNEIKQIRSFLELCQLKSEHPLQVEFQLEGETDNAMIEPLLLLPFVENAIKHGDLEINPEAYLRIRLSHHAGTLDFVVENSYDPLNQQKDEHSGVGLENVRRRLELNHAGRFDLSLHDDGKKYLIHLKIKQL